MLKQSFPSLKPILPPLYLGSPGSFRGSPAYQNKNDFTHHGYIVNRVPTDADKTKAARMKIDPIEFVRRDDIVHDCYTKAAVNPGDVVYPASNNDYHEMGVMVVTGSIRTYYMYGETEEWPTSDNPFTVQLRCRDQSKNKGVINCTWNWFSKTHPLTAVNNGC